MTKRLKRINPLQLGKVLGLIYAIGSLVIVPFFLLFSLIASLAPTGIQGSHSAALGVGMGIGFLFVMPVIYGFAGFLSGLIGGLLYNLVAKWVGGIEVEVE